MSNTEVIRAINADGTARRYFHYREDGKTDTWRSFAEQALLHRDWHGDCDDLASTALDLLARGVTPGPVRAELTTRMYRLKVKSAQCRPGIPYDHMIAAVKIGADLWIIGDTFTKAHKIEASPHSLLKPGRIYSHSKVSEGVVWRAGFGDLLKPA